MNSAPRSSRRRFLERSVAAGLGLASFAVGPRASRQLSSVESAARFLVALRQDSGLIGGSGFYIDAPPREGCDGITQGYAVHAVRQLAKLFRGAEEPTKAVEWVAQADRLAKAFTEAFWREDHFGE